MEKRLHITHTQMSSRSTKYIYNSILYFVVVIFFVSVDFFLAMEERVLTPVTPWTCIGLLK